MKTKHEDIIKAELAMNRVAVVIPCYKVTRHILGILKGIKKPVERIYCVDDACPDNSGKFIEKHNKDKRIRVLYHEKNKGAGGAAKTGYQAALDDGMDIIVKVDGDGQMDPTLIPRFIQPILLGHADFTKGNRFFNLEDVREMPFMRLIGNAGLSFLTKLSSGYWHLFDPANGYTAIHAATLSALPLDKLSNGFSLESDLLFRLNTIGAVVQDVPMRAIYADEESNLNLIRSFFHFFGLNLKNFFKRIFYNYYLRDFNLASLQLSVGAILLLFGIIYGSVKWLTSIQSGIAVTSGTVMVAALPIILGLQLVLAFLAYDTQGRHDLPFFLRSGQMK